jgi:hypothetical protein
VPELATIGVVAVTVTMPEHVLALDGKWPNVLTRLCSRPAMLNLNEPWVNARFSRLYCWVDPFA